MNKRGESARILYLEDDQEWQEKIKEYLGDRYDLLTVHDPAQAEGMLFPTRSSGGKMADTTPFQLFIADISLVLGNSGDEQGLRFIEDIRNRESLHRQAGELSDKLKIMILTAYPWRERIKVAFRDLRVTDFLDKGHISRAVLLSAVERAFRD